MVRSSRSGGDNPPKNNEIRVQLFRAYVPLAPDRLEVYKVPNTVELGKGVRGTLDLLPGLYQLTVNRDEANERTFFAEVQAGKNSTVVIND